MDPNKALLGIRETARFIVAGTAGDMFEESAEELAQQALDLDEWLCRGGFLPKSWSRDSEKDQRGARLEKALRGLLQDIGEVLERQGEDWWDETVTSGTYHRDEAEKLTGGERIMSAYTLTLTAEDLDSIAFVGGRYAWSDALRQLEAGENHLEEPEAWAIAEAFEADTEGGHQPFPMLDPRSDLASKLMAFWASIV